MSTVIYPVISSLTYSMISTFHGKSEISDPLILNLTANILYRKVFLMPTFLKVPVLILTVVFDLYGLVTTGVKFHKQSPWRRQNQISQWKNSKLEVFPNFIQFYQTLAVFIYCSEHDPFESS